MSAFEFLEPKKGPSCVHMLCVFSPPSVCIPPSITVSQCDVHKDN